MKILFICLVGRHYSPIINELRKTNHVDFVFINSKWKIDSGNYHIPRLFSRHIGYRLLKFLTVSYLLIVKNYDFCVTDCDSVLGASFFPIIRTYTKMIRTEFIHDIRTIPVDHPDYLAAKREKKFSWQIWFVNKFYQGISFITDEMKKYIEINYEAIKKPFVIWETGVDTKIFSPIAKNIDLKKRLEFHKEDFICFYHGDITEKRGIVELVESFAITSKREKQVKLLILGEGHYRDELQLKIKNLGLEGIVKTHNWVEIQQVPQFISIADLCIVPLPDIDWWRVSSPLKLMEYIASGKTILLSDIVAHKSVVGINNGVFFIPNVTSEGMSTKILEAYSIFKTHPDKFYEIGLHTRTKLIDNLSWENRSKQFEQYLINFHTPKAKLS